MLPVEDSDLDDVEDDDDEAEQGFWGFSEHVVVVTLEVDDVELVDEDHGEVAGVEPGAQAEGGVVDDLRDQPEPLQQNKQSGVVVVEQADEVHQAQAIEHHVSFDGVNRSDNRLESLREFHYQTER